MGPLVNRRAVDDMQDGLRRVREQGGEILFAAKRWKVLCAPGAGERAPEMAILKEEIFAPILCLIEFEI